MSSSQLPLEYAGEDHDAELDAVQFELYRLDPTGDRIARVLRDTLDQLYDGQRTGRWNFSQLFKTEKTHMGTLVEINLQREFEFEDGDATDYRIAGIEVDCKYSMKYGGWTLPPEVVGHIALLITADDDRATWHAGLVRVKESYLNLGRNRDAKTTLSSVGRVQVRELWPDVRFLAPNIYIELDEITRNRIFSARARFGNRHGQARTNELFRSVHGRIIRRAEVATVAQQDDFMKRARSNGGSRTALQSDGIVILGHKERKVAAQLGLPVPRNGEFVAARVIPARADRNDPVSEIAGTMWSVARPGDPTVAAPPM
ncbi:NaeI family type II restriction endonuclease [Nocardia altamirensis]|uniref:NaeI family type II restriction endonuclease n=1 Tax=Nocardia altamirensis TaxID=472158 RepID=UPI0009FCBE63|nr:NaeI family type II restriction endonuclease [Nocardia altamirensis]